MKIILEKLVLHTVEPGYELTHDAWNDLCRTIGCIVDSYDSRMVFSEEGAIQKDVV